MKRSLTIFCGEMMVVNQGYWFQLTADRKTDKLVCRGIIGGIGIILPIGFTITFPECRVYYISPGNWRVVPVMAKGYLDLTNEYIQISYPEELVLREGWSLVAQVVDSIDDNSYIELKNGKRLLVKSRLPLAKSSPVGWGLKRFLVEPVILPGSVEWPEDIIDSNLI